MLVVRRVQVRDVGFDGLGRVEGVEGQRASLAGAGARQHGRQAQGEVVVCARGPLLEVRHLHAGGAVHPVGRFHERHQHDRLEFGREMQGGNVLANRVHAFAVLGVEEPRLLAKGLREVARSARHGIALGDQRLGVARDVGVVGLHIAARQHVGVGIVVVGDHAKAGGLERVPHPRRATEQVEHRPRARVGAHGVDDERQQCALGSEVFDHALETMRAQGAQPSRAPLSAGVTRAEFGRQARGCGTRAAVRYARGCACRYTCLSRSTLVCV